MHAFNEGKLCYCMLIFGGIYSRFSVNLQLTKLVVLRVCTDVYFHVVPILNLNSRNCIRNFFCTELHKDHSVRLSELFAAMMFFLCHMSELFLLARLVFLKIIL